MLSVIIPAYNEEVMLPKAAAVLTLLFTEQNIVHELIFIDDGSKDSTWEQITQASKTYPDVHGIHFSRNFSKEAAICAGLGQARGDCVAVMDCDLQHPPQTLVEMYRNWEEGYEVIEGMKRTRGTESIAHRSSAGMFYRLMSAVTKIDMSRASDFKLLDRKAVDAILEMPEYNSFFRAQSFWVGFKTASVEYDIQEREAGQTKWSTIALIRYAVVNIVSYSTVPMQFVTIAGLIVFLFGIILGIQTLVNYFLGRAVEGFTTVILLILFLGSIVMISLGIIGYYISLIYQEVQRRPKYIISKKI